MALIQCPECKTEVSEKAGQCIKCGHPINAVSVKKIGKVLAAIVVGLLMAIGVLVVIGISFRSFHKSDYVSKPALPIVITYRKAFLSSGLVAIFRNETNSNITVLARFTDPQLSVSRNYRLTIGPLRILEFGHLQGWDFEDGDQIILKNNEYAILQVRIP